MFEGASSKSIPEGKRDFALAAVRHQKSSPLISGQKRTQSDVKGQENPGHASGVRLLFPSSTGNSAVTEPRASTWMIISGRQKREQQNPSSSGCNEIKKNSAQASRDRLQSTLKDYDYLRNLLSRRVELNPNLSSRVQKILEILRKIRFDKSATDTATWCIFARDCMCASLHMRTSRQCWTSWLGVHLKTSKAKSQSPCVTEHKFSRRRPGTWWMECTTCRVDWKHAHSQRASLLRLVGPGALDASGAWYVENEDR